MTDQSEWVGRVGHVWAAEWQRTDRSFGPLTDRLIEVATASEFSQALDVGCGAGELSLRLAEGHPSSRIIGVDVSEELLDAARFRASELANLRFEHGDAAEWAAGKGERADLVVSRHGVMFFGDPVAAFLHIAGQAAPSARLVFSCFREPSENAWVRELVSALPKNDGLPPDPDAPGPFAFGRREKVERILSDAGWQDTAFEAIDYGMVAGEGTEAVEDALSYFLRIGPAARAVAALEGAERETALDRLRGVIQRHLERGQVSLPAACWIVTARARG